MRSVLLVEDEEQMRSTFADAISASGDFSLVAAVATVKAGKAAFDLQKAVLLEPGNREYHIALSDALPADSSVPQAR